MNKYIWEIVKLKMSIHVFDKMKYDINIRNNRKNINFKLKVLRLNVKILSMSIDK